MQVRKSIERIQEYARDRGIGPKKLSEMSGISASALRHLSNPDWSPTVRTIEKIEAAIEREKKAERSLS